MAAKGRAHERLMAALKFLDAFAKSLRLGAPLGHEDDYERDAVWWPGGPAYSWSRYGDFDPLTIRAGIRAGLIEEPRTNRYRLTDAGRRVLTPTGAQP